MTTVVNNPAPQDNGGNSLLIGAIVFIGLVLIVVFVGIPAIRRMGPAQITIPAPQIVVPDTIDVNVQPAK